MGLVANIVTAGAIACAGAAVVPGVSSVTYSPFTSGVTPPGLVVVQLSSAAAPNTITVDTNSPPRMREGNNVTNTSGSHYTAGVFPETMIDGRYEVKIGNAQIATSSRGIGGGYCNSDRTKMVFFIICGNTTACRIFTYVSGTLTPVGTTQNTFVTSSSDTAALRYAISGSDIVYTVYKNGSATTVTWTDTGGATIGTPGRKPMVAFRHEYSGGNFASPGIKSLETVML